MFSKEVVVLRARKGVPGVGRKLSKHFNANEVTALHKPQLKVPSGAKIINYGRSVEPIWLEEALERGCRVINTAGAVQLCVDKLKTLRKLWIHGVPALSFCDNRESAQHWLDNGQAVIVRHTTKGKQGKGVELVEPGANLPNAPLYTKFYDKTNEFRVHIADGKVIDYVQKKKMGRKKLDKLGIQDVDSLLRNHKKGWVFAHNDLLEEGQEAIKAMSLAGAAALGIDFCGVDVLARYDGNTFIDAVVCEINSAPGMSSPTTFNAYCKAFEEM